MNVNYKMEQILVIKKVNHILIILQPPKMKGWSAQKQWSSSSLGFVAQQLAKNFFRQIKTQKSVSQFALLLR